MAPERRLVRRFWAYACCEDAVVLYPLYAVLFTDHGLSPAAVSSLFVLWSLTGFVLEVPSGAWADVVSRRLLLAAAPLLTGTGFALWTFAPSYPAFAAGFVLWGVGGALRSGTAQAFVHSELAAVGRADRYAAVIGRAESLAVGSAVAATLLAAPVMAAGGYHAVGAASVLAQVAAAAVAITLPRAVAPGGAPPAPPSGGGSGQPAQPDDGGGRAGAGGGPPLPTGPGPQMSAATPVGISAGTDGPARQGTATWRAAVAALRAGVGEVRGSRPIRRALMGVGALSAVASLDEYVPLLVAAVGIPPAGVPVGMGVVLAGMAVGGWCAGWGAGRAGAVLGVAAGSLAVGAGSGAPAGLVGVAVTFGAVRWAGVLADARLQERVGDRARATVTSIAGLGSEVGALAAFAGYAAGSLWVGPAVLFAAGAVPLAVLAAVWSRSDVAARRSLAGRSGSDGPSLRSQQR